MTHQLSLQHINTTVGQVKGRISRVQHQDYQEGKVITVITYFSLSL